MTMDSSAAPVDSADPVAQLDELVSAWSAEADAAERRRLEFELVPARIAAFSGLVAGAPPESNSPCPTAAPPAPELHRGELTVEAVRERILTYGCAIVRGLVPQATVDELVRGIDLAMDGRQAFLDGTAGAEPDSSYHQLVHDDAIVNLPQMRMWTEDSGAVLAADSPRMLQQLCEMLHVTALHGVISAYLGARPATSVKKCVLRRVPITAGSEWHQDGSFLGADIHALNVWTCLSDCGTDAPGLDIVPRRLDLLPTGTDGALFSWSIAPELVSESAGRVGIHRPAFGPGDVVLFDGMFLHRTAVSEAMTRDRYAIESWFFSPATYPAHHLALVI